MFIADSWFSSQELLLQTIISGFRGLFAIKAKVAVKNRFVKVKDLGEPRDFNLVTVKGNKYRYIELTTQLFTGKIPVKLIISQVYDPPTQKWCLSYYLH